MKFAWCLLFCTLLFATFANADMATGILTETMKNGIKKLGMHCMKAVGATMEEMNSIKHGPPYKGKAGCAIACILDKAGVMADNKYTKTGFIAAVKPFVLGNTQKLNHIKTIAESCEKEVSPAANECAVAESIIVCLRKHIPQLSELDL